MTGIRNMQETQLPPERQYSCGFRCMAFIIQLLSCLQYAERYLHMVSLYAFFRDMRLHGIAQVTQEQRDRKQATCSSRLFYTVSDGLIPFHI